MWAEEPKLASVVQMLREGVAAVVRCSALVLFQEGGEKLLFNITERTVVFNVEPAKSYSTVRPTARCSLGGKTNYEVANFDDDW